MTTPNKIHHSNIPRPFSGQTKAGGNLFAIKINIFEYINMFIELYLPFAKTRWIVSLAVAFMACSLSFSQAALVESFDDIEYWVGTGSNSSALVIQWNDGENPVSVVWGYRWDDEDAPTVQTLMFDLAGQISFSPVEEGAIPPVLPPGADSRLSLAIDVYLWGIMLTGISYDQNGLASGEFSQITRSQSGYLWTLYELGSGSAWPGGSVMPADWGMSGISLVNEGWYGWTYTNAYDADYNPVSFSFDAPVAAVPEPSTWLLLVGSAIVICFRKKNHATEGCI